MIHPPCFLVPIRFLWMNLTHPTTEPVNRFWVWILNFKLIWYDQKCVMQSQLHFQTQRQTCRYRCSTFHFLFFQRNSPFLLWLASWWQVGNGLPSPTWTHPTRGRDRWIGAGYLPLDVNVSRIPRCEEWHVPWTSGFCVTVSVMRKWVTDTDVSHNRVTVFVS